MATEAEPQPSRGRRPWERIAGRLYGPPRPGAFAEAAKDLKSWVRQDRVVLVAGAGLVLLAGLLTLAGVQTVGHAATATYTLLGLFGLWLIVVQTGQPALGHAALMGLGGVPNRFSTAPRRARRPHRGDCCRTVLRRSGLGPGLGYLPTATGIHLPGHLVLWVAGHTVRCRLPRYQRRHCRHHLWCANEGETRASRD